MDLVPYLGFIPANPETVEKAVPRGTIIRVYFNPAVKGDYRVRTFTAPQPAAASETRMLSAAKFGCIALGVTGTALFAPLRFRKVCLGAPLSD
jgi:hypothetical protein